MCLGFVFATPPVVENITASQRTDGSKIVDIYYDVSDTDGDSLVYIDLVLSIDGGETFTTTPTQTSGDIGDDIQQGDNKHIIWNAGNEIFTLEGNQYQFKVIAEDWWCGKLFLVEGGNEYETVQIGDQCWFAENLKETHYRNGDPIPTGYNISNWSNLNTGAYSVYNNQESSANTYGYLYNWYAVNDNRNIAPEGWHVPTDNEWKTLEMELGMSVSEANNTGWRGTNEGSQLAGNSGLWNGGNLESNSEFGTSGFTALPGGYRSNDGSYDYMGNFGYFWSSSAYYSSNAWYRKLYFYSSDVYRYNSYRKYGYSVRCIRN